jgi:hypothetical protein
MIFHLKRAEVYVLIQTEHPPPPTSQKQDTESGRLHSQFQGSCLKGDKSWELYSTNYTHFPYVLFAIMNTSLDLIFIHVSQKPVLQKIIQHKRNQLCRF